MTNEEKIQLSRGLPKWPQMYTTGVPVQVSEAKEIIRRTDTFFDGHGGNDHNFDRRFMQNLRIFDFFDVEGPAREAFDYMDMWQKQWGFLRTEYVHNSWISCSFVGGPHGWMHPTGSIGFTDNIGKHPSAETVFEEWSKIAEAWPFLDVGVTLMSGEDCEEAKEPVISFAIKDGKVTVHLPGEIDVHAGHPTPAKRDLATSVLGVFAMAPSEREHGIPRQWLFEWSLQAVKLNLPPMPKMKENRLR